MPTYAYACTDCDHRFEAFQSFSDDSLTVCPECDGRLRKVFNAVGVVFKGGGFYRTDSRKESASARSGSSDGSKAGSSEGSSDGSSGAAKDSSGSGSKGSGSKGSGSGKGASSSSSTGSSSPAAKLAASSTAAN